MIRKANMIRHPDNGTLGRSHPRPSIRSSHCRAGYHSWSADRGISARSTNAQVPMVSAPDSKINGEMSMEAAFADFLVLARMAGHPPAARAERRLGGVDLALRGQDGKRR